MAGNGPVWAAKAAADYTAHVLWHDANDLNGHYEAVVRVRSVVRAALDAAKEKLVMVRLAGEDDAFWEARIAELNVALDALNGRLTFKDPH